jgi:hypothetical protein
MPSSLATSATIGAAPVPCATTHASRHENHIRSVQSVGDPITIFEGRCSPHLGVGTGAQTFSNACAQLQHRFRTDIRKGLRVSIGANKIHAVDLVIDHVANGVTATATDTDHLDHGTLWCTVYKFKHRFLPFLKKAPNCRALPKIVVLKI